MVITIARNVRFDLRRGAGSSLEILFGKVSLTPTLTHTVGTSTVLPAPSTFDLVNGIAIATNVATTPAPVAGQIEWAYKVKIEDNRGKSFEYLVGVPDGTTEINFNVLPRYFETKPPLFGEGPQGIPGAAATITIGTTTSGPTPAVTNTGTSKDAVLNFTLAKGDKGDTGAGYALLTDNLPAANLPNSYPEGSSYFRVASASVMVDWLGYRGFVVTDRKSSYVVQTYTGSLGEGVSTRTSNDGISWTVWKSPAASTLATPLLNGLMPALDKVKLDGMTPAANSKSFASLASTYPVGFSTLQVRATDGWPLTTDGQLVTHKTSTGNSFVGQWLHSAEEGAPQYRVSDAAGNWLPFAVVGTRDYVTNRTDSNLLNTSAVLDGTTDSTAVVQAYLDSLPSGATVSMPHNLSLKIDGPINITKPVTINNWNLNLGANNKGFYVTSSDVTIRGCKLSGAGISAGYVNGNRAIRIEGVKGSPLKGVRIEYNDITGINDTGISTAWTVNEKILYNRVETFNYAGILSSSVIDSTIEGNYIKGAVHNGNINSYGIAVTDGTNILDDRSRRVMIRGNFVFDIPEWEGIDTHGGEAISIIGNVVYGARRAIQVLQGNTTRLAAPQKAVITGNVIDGAGVPAATTGITLAGNTDLSMLADGVISGNAVYNCTTPGIVTRVDWSKTEVSANVGIGDGYDKGWASFEADSLRAGWFSNSTYPVRYRFVRGGGKTTVYLEGVLSRTSGVNADLIQLLPELNPGYAKVIGPTSTTTQVTGLLEITAAGRLRLIFAGGTETGNVSVTGTYTF